MKIFILTILVGMAIANITASEFIFAQLREYIESKTNNMYIINFINCPICQSFWFTLFISFFTLNGVYIIAAPLIATFVSRIIFSFLKY